MGTVKLDLQLGKLAALPMSGYTRLSFGTRILYISCDSTELIVSLLQSAATSDDHP